jgi:ATP-dependent protease ClpP protease subunit
MMITKVNTTDSRRFFNAAVDNDTLILDMFDVIGSSDLFGNGITSTAVKAALDESGDCPNVTMNINSKGGDLFEGVAIFNLLRNSGKTIHCNVVGLAASAASLIACAGNTVTMGVGSSYMLHEAEGICAGYGDDMHKMGDTLSQVTNSAADIYKAKTGMAKDKVLALMKAETWLTPKEAVAQGFADAVSKKNAQPTNMYDLSNFKNVPEELKNEVSEETKTEADDFNSAAVHLKQIQLMRG